MRFLTHAISILALVGIVAASPIDAATADIVALETRNATLEDDPPPMPGPFCTRNSKMIPIWRYYYELQIPYVPEEVSIGDLCHSFWRELKGQPMCTVSSPHGCEPIVGRHLKWHFHTHVFCDKKMVQGAFWEATRNQWGALDGCKSVGT